MRERGGAAGPVGAAVEGRAHEGEVVQQVAVRLCANGVQHVGSEKHGFDEDEGGKEVGTFDAGIKRRHRPH